MTERLDQKVKQEGETLLKAIATYRENVTVAIEQAMQDGMSDTDVMAIMTGRGAVLQVAINRALSE